MRAVANSYGWKGPLPETRQVLALDRRTLSAYTGEYQIPGLTKLTVSMSAAGELYAVVAILGSRRIELLAQTPTHFFDLETGITVEFVRDAGGNVSHAKIGGPYGSHDAVRDK